MVEQEQEPDQMVQEALIQIQQQETHQGHWERTARTTAETVVVVEPVVAWTSVSTAPQEPLQ